LIFNGLNLISEVLHRRRVVVLVDEVDGLNFTGFDVPSTVRRILRVESEMRNRGNNDTNKAIQFLISSLIDTIERLAVRLDATRAAVLHEQYNALRLRAVQAVRDSDLVELTELIGEVSGKADL
jgi:hypothetical protein